MSETKRALVLMAHGSPDPDWVAPLRRVLERMRELDPAAAIELALLTDEGSLERCIVELEARGHLDIEVIAALLSAGGRHFKRDIPALVEAAAARHPKLSIRMRPRALGAADEVIEALALAALSAN